MNLPELLRQQFDAAAAHPEPSVVPLLTEMVGKTRVLGTGTLLEVDGHHFIVTAGHVIDDLKQSGLWIPLGQTRAPVRGVGGTFVRADGEGDKFDIAVVEITDDRTIANLKESWTFLTLDDIAFRAEQMSGTIYWFLVYGFPASQTWTEGTALMHAPIRLLTLPYTGPTDDVRGDPVDPKIHLLLAHNDESTDGSGNLSVVPRLNGISGSSIWAITTNPAGVWSPSKNMRVIGVQTAVLKKRWIRSTSWRVVADMLRKYDPSLQESISAAFRRPASSS